jgi:hypothetical protein
VSGDVPLIVVEAHNRPVIATVREVLTRPGLPAMTLIGGLAVAVRVGAMGTAHRATTDVDFVTAEIATDAAVEVVGVDLIVTHAVDERELDGLDDDQRLFVAGHRWAFERGTPMRLAASDDEFVELAVATPAGLVATKSHAVGFPNSRRRANKQPSDLLDLFRLVDAYDIDGALVAELRAGPNALARIVADVTQRSVLDNPARAAMQMATASPAPIDRDRLADVMQTFVEGLRR